MPQTKLPSPLVPEELAQAVAILAQCLLQARIRFSISGGAATMLTRMEYGLGVRSTEDIDLVVQPRGDMNAETIAPYLFQHHPTVFAPRILFGTSIPTLAFIRADETIIYIDIEIFDILGWPQRPQYNLDDPDNDTTIISVAGVDIPVFSLRWLLREKIVTAFDRKGSRKEQTDINDANALLEIIAPNTLDLTNHENATRYIYVNYPNLRRMLELKVICRNVLGEPWKWNEAASVFWRMNGGELQYIDADFGRHEFNWDRAAKFWYLNTRGQCWGYNKKIDDIGPI